MENTKEFATMNWRNQMHLLNAAKRASNALLEWLNKDGSREGVEQISKRLAVSIKKYENKEMREAAQRLEDSNLQDLPSYAKLLEQADSHQEETLFPHSQIELGREKELETEVS